MALKGYKPTTPSKRHAKLLKFELDEVLPENLSKKEKEALKKQIKEHEESKPNGLVKNLKYKAGRNNQGGITTRHKGGRVKRNYRVIDFKRDKFDIEAEVVSVEYDPNRSANIALLKYEDGEYRYILAPEKLKVTDKIMSSKTFKELKSGNAYPLSEIPAATFVHNIELSPGKGAVMARSAGAGVQVQGQVDKGYVQLKMPSGEVRLVKGECMATIGMVGNQMHSNQKLGKAGRKRKKGIRPTVRGVAQSYKHPHAGGQGKGGRHGPGGPVKDPWGNKRGKITRKNKKTDKYIVKRRKSRGRKRNKPYKNIA
jgi:large subunit ribosomal protein L2